MASVARSGQYFWHKDAQIRLKGPSEQIDEEDLAMESSEAGKEPMLSLNVVTHAPLWLEVMAAAKELAESNPTNADFATCFKEKYMGLINKISDAVIKSSGLKSDEKG